MSWPSPHPVTRRDDAERPAILVVLAMLAAAFAFAVAVMPTAHAATPVRIMPLGDSITGSPGCWRALLWNRLQSAGFTDIDFVGTLGPQGCSVPYDGDNEGHGGALVTTVADQNQLVGWLSATQPDIVVMHFGTNDVWSNRSTATILAAYGKLVDQMRASNPAMKILVAKIIPMAASACGTGCPERVVDLNNAIPGWAASKTTSQSPITVVDQWTGFSTTSDTYDGIHPNAAGDQKISDKWFPALTAALGTVATTPPPQPPGTPGTPTASGVTASSVGLMWAASTGTVSRYEVERCTGSTCTNFAQVGISTTNSFINNSGLTANTTYRYRVRAVNSAGTSPYSGILNVTTGATTGCVPANFRVTGTTPSSISLAWSPPPAACNTAGYELFRAGSSGAFARIAVLPSAGTTTYTDSGLPSATTLRYQLRSQDTQGNLSAFTNPLTAATGTVTTTTTSTPPPGGCSATYRLVNNWGSGFQGEITVTNTGTTPTTSWTVTLTFANGQRITQIWGGRTSQTSSPYTITNEAWNGVLAPDASTAAGFIGSASGTSNPPMLTCARTP